MNIYRPNVRALAARTAAAIAATGIAALAVARPATAEPHQKWIAVNCPQPYSQECNASGAFDVVGTGDVFVEFYGDEAGCADIIDHVYVSGVEFNSGLVRPGGQDGGVLIPAGDIPESPDGRYHITVSAEGVLGGCNTGSMSGWAGTLYVVDEA